MLYVFDTSVFSNIFNHYHSNTFPTLWKKLDQCIAHNTITSVEEAKFELDNWREGWAGNIDAWIQKNKTIFTPPFDSEQKLVRTLLKSPDVRGLVKKQQLNEGRPQADPWIIAKAHVLKATVVSMEKRKRELNRRLPQGYSQIPDVCDRLKIPCINLQEFMSKEKWRF